MWGKGNLKREVAMTKIEWTEKTWNPIIGCSKVSEGCKNCYAEKMSARLSSMNNKIGDAYKEVIINKKFIGQLLFISDRAKQPYFWEKPRMVFVNSMSDFFHDTIIFQISKSLIKIMEDNPRHIFQILTKRPEHALKFFEWYKKPLPDNIWLGVSIEMKKYLHRIELLRLLPAKVKFISFEPLLEDIGEIDLSGIDWVIVGGESGHNRRPFNPDWARNILQQCKDQNIAFFMKQWDKVNPIPEDLMIREYPTNI